MNDFISVIIPADNGAKTIGPCLEAVRASNFGDYEVIVVTGRSGRGAAAPLSGNLADKIIEAPDRLPRSRLRYLGAKEAKGNIIVNIDSDVIIMPDTLGKIYNYFEEHPEISALTGLLAKEHKNKDFFSQYKNLYMYYIFQKLPRDVNFLYGSIYAVRKSMLPFSDNSIEVADDTVMGQQLALSGKKIHFLRDLEVLHLKKYDAVSFFKNEFRIPFDWARIFLKYRGWSQLGKNGTGYLHSPKEQLISIMSAAMIFLLIPACLFLSSAVSLIFLLILIWLSVNLRFLAFLSREKGLIFGMIAFFVTFADNVVMAAGILCGFTYPRRKYE